MWYDPTRKRIYIPSGEGFIFVYRQIDADRYERIVKIPSAIGAGTSVYTGQVGKHNSLYRNAGLTPHVSRSCEEVFRQLT
jgi:hypothetical protein